MKTLPFDKGDIRVTSIYGMRTLNGITKRHNGLDMVGMQSKNIVSVSDGTVAMSRIVTDRSNTTWEWGNYVAILNTDGKLCYYCHLSERKVKVGQKVKAGQVIGIEGSTGYSTGSHLHFEVRAGSTPVNAADYLGIRNVIGTVQHCSSIGADSVIKGESLNGVDVSVYQGNIDWNKVKADGIDFAIIKATQGRAVNSNAYLFTDRQFANNITNAHKAGIRCGVYHYLTAKTVKEAQVEAEHFLATIKPYRDKVTLYAAVDVEEKKYLPSNKTLLTQIVDAFCSYVKADGYKPIVYTNPDFINYWLNDISQWDLWLALWNGNKEKVPTSYRNMKIWQWSNSIRVNGINGSVDGNVGYFDVDTKPIDIPKNNSLTHDGEDIQRGDIVEVVKGQNYLYGTNKKFTVWFNTYQVLQLVGDRAVIGKNAVITAAINTSNLKRV